MTENESSRNWVAEGVDAQGHTQMVGMIVTWIILDEAHVATIAVHPDFRHLGIGRQLLARGLLDTRRRAARSRPFWRCGAATWQPRPSTSSSVLK